jgi:pyruvate formate lyase activating enzyme
LIIGGLQKFSLSDFPGRISAIVFTRGCNFRCPYCHNPELVDPERYVSPISEVSLLSYLRTRIGLLQGIVISGGEPTIHDDLPDFIGRIRALGYAIKLDTNGSRPALLRELISGGLVEFVALDMKAPLSRYDHVVRAPVDTDDLRCSIRLVVESGIPHEMRTTFLPSLLSASDLREIADTVRGCSRLVVQGFRPTKALDPGFLKQQAPTQQTLDAICADIESMGVPCLAR